MRIDWMVVALLGLYRSAGAADVTVFVTGDAAALTYMTRSAADSIFRTAGITVDWQGPKPPAAGVPPAWLRIELADRTADDFLPGALAVSYPYAACQERVTVFLDRIRLLAPGILRESALLAYVLVHEITHVIQGVDRHSAGGLMKAHWDGHDRTAIFARRLGFLDEDVLLLRTGLAAGWCRQTAALIDRSGPRIAGRPR
jgi:hypothetical protein